MASRFNVSPRRFAFVTLHRPSNVDAPESLQRIFSQLMELSTLVPVIFPVHPRTRERLETLDNLMRTTAGQPNLHLIHPLGYLEFIGLMAHAGVVLNDSGGIQEETTILNVPCVTLRSNTERSITVTERTNVLVGHNTSKLLGVARWALNERGYTPSQPPQKWDGKASSRIVDFIENVLD